MRWMENTNCQISGKCCSTIHLYLPNTNIFCKNERGFLRGARACKKNLSLPKNTFPYNWNLSPKNMVKTRKHKFPKSSHIPTI